MMIRSYQFLLVFVFAIAISHSVLAEKLLKAKVIVEGKVILEGSTSDDGKADPDEIWERLSKVKLRKTDAFEGVVTPGESEEVLIEKEGTLEITQGGLFRFQSIKLKKSLKDGEERWQVDSNLITEWAQWRFISRRDARLIQKP